MHAVNNVDAQRRLTKSATVVYLNASHKPQSHKRPLEDTVDTPHTSAGRKGKKRRPSSAARKETTAGARTDRYVARPRS